MILAFIEIQDLLSQFPNTSERAVMDIKIGTRTFLESEVANSTKRKDLYKKMIDIDPSAPTEEERQIEAITKLRYMQFREKESSTSSLGFRIEAAQVMITIVILIIMFTPISFPLFQNVFFKSHTLLSLRN